MERWKRTDIYGFNKRLALAEQDYLEKLEAEIDRRAIDGIDHPVIHQGVITDTYKQYSDNLLMFKTKRVDPEYRDTVRSTPEATSPITKIIIHMPPGRGGQPLVIEGAARLLPEERIPPDGESSADVQEPAPPA